MVDKTQHGEGDPLRTLRESLRRGDHQAFLAFVNAHQQFVGNLVVRLVPSKLVDDTMQEIFLSAFNALSSGEVVRNVTAWLRQISVRRAADALRSEYRERRKCEELQSIPKTTSRDDCADVLYAHQLYDHVRNQLSPNEQLLLQLILVDDVPIAEAARDLGASVTATKVRVFRLKQKLKALAGKYDR